MIEIKFQISKEIERRVYRNIEKNHNNDFKDINEYARFCLIKVTKLDEEVFK